MKPNRKKFLAPLLGLILLLGGLALGAITLNFASIWVIVICTIGLGLYLTLFFSGAPKASRGKTISSVLTLIFLVGCFACLFELSENRKWHWDLTEGRNYSLSPQSISYLESIDRDVKIIAFARPASLRSVTKYLKRCALYNNRIAFQVSDPEAEPESLKDIDSNNPPDHVDYNETWIITYKDADGRRVVDQKKKFTGYRPASFTNGSYEEAVVNTLAQMESQESMTLYFLRKHGEVEVMADPTGNDRRPTISVLRRELQQRSIKLKSLDVMNLTYVPEDCDVLVVACPKIDLAVAEAEIIGNWLAKGGKAIFLMNPPQRRDTNLHNFSWLFRQFGMRVQTESVIFDDTAMSLQSRKQYQFPLYEFDLDHAITQDYYRRDRMFFAWAMPASGSPEAEAFNYTPLFYASPQSWAMAKNNAIAYVQSKQFQHPENYQQQVLSAAVSLSILNENSDKTMQIFFFGDGNRFLDGDIGIPQIKVLFNALNWMGDRKARIIVPPRKLKNTPSRIEPFQLQMMVAWIVIIIPAFILFGGLGLTTMRRQMR